MRMPFVACALLFVASLLSAQQPSGPYPPSAPERYRLMVQDQSIGALQVEVRNVIQGFAGQRKVCERDLAVLDHTRKAVAILSNEARKDEALEKAKEELKAAENLQPDFVVRQGLIRAREAVEAALVSPITADFARLEMTIENEAVHPARQAVAANARVMQDETLKWLEIQELISQHLGDVADLTSRSLEQTH